MLTNLVGVGNDNNGAPDIFFDDLPAASAKEVAGVEVAGVIVAVVDASSPPQPTGLVCNR